MGSIIKKELYKKKSEFTAEMPEEKEMAFVIGEVDSTEATKYLNALKLGSNVRAEFSHAADRKKELKLVKYIKNELELE